ncbi:hypothetical protein [Mycoplasma sp. ATU-Cv-703]|uniref:hypothetical protein n=1 Tax=Mycoplasma sp. ATU-Cv-703 TaxID=2498595 RepID=UPI000FDD427D
MKPTYETDAQHAEISQPQPNAVQAPNFLPGKILIWVAVVVSLFTTLLALISPTSFVSEYNMGQANRDSFVIATSIYSALGNLLYALPLFLVKRTNVMRVWAIVWLILAVLGLVFLPLNLRMFGPLSTVLGLANAVLILVGSILIIVKANQAQKIDPRNFSQF